MQETDNLLKTLNVKSLLEALLVYTPKGYKDLNLLKHFELGLSGVLEVDILDKRNYAKVLKIFAYSKRFYKNLELVFSITAHSITTSLKPARVCSFMVN